MVITKEKPKADQPKLITDPVESAKVAGLRYVSDVSPGIRRKRAGKRFSYIDVDGKLIRDRHKLQRLKALGIPPASNGTGCQGTQAVSLPSSLAGGTRRDEVYSDAGIWRSSTPDPQTHPARSSTTWPV